MSFLVNYYVFTEIKNPITLGEDWFSICKHLELKGILLISREGVNIALYGAKEKLEEFIDTKLKALGEINIEVFRMREVDYPPFRRLRLKVKKEIITSGFAENLKMSTGDYIQVSEFQKLSKLEDVVLLDVRNDYEYKIGSFKNALLLPISKFSKFSNFSKELEKHKNKKFLTFCTGGVRCEKVVPFLKERGYDVKQLHGGILNYLEVYGQRNDSIWDGECFVFDDRVSIKSDLTKGTYHWCEVCGQPKRDELCVICSVETSNSVIR